MAGLVGLCQMAATSSQKAFCTLALQRDNNKYVIGYISIRSVIFQLELIDTVWVDLYSTFQVTGNRGAIHKCL